MFWKKLFGLVLGVTVKYPFINEVLQSESEARC